MDCNPPGQGTLQPEWRRPPGNRRHFWQVNFFVEPEQGEIRFWCVRRLNGMKTRTNQSCGFLDGIGTIKKTYEKSRKGSGSLGKLKWFSRLNWVTIKNKPFRFQPFIFQGGKSHKSTANFTPFVTPWSWLTDQQVTPWEFLRSPGRNLADPTNDFRKWNAFGTV